MKQRTTIATAGNTLAPALAVLHDMVYSVSREEGGKQLYRAENEHCVLIAEDPLLLLGLATIYEARGASWQPSDEEVAALLAIDGNGA
jgi:hypothetical protein